MVSNYINSKCVFPGKQIDVAEVEGLGSGMKLFELFTVYIIPRSKKYLKHRL